MGIGPVVGPPALKRVPECGGGSGAGCGVVRGAKEGGGEGLGRGGGEGLGEGAGEGLGAHRSQDCTSPRSRPKRTRGAELIPASRLVRRGVTLYHNATTTPWSLPAFTGGLRWRILLRCSSGAPYRYQRRSTVENGTGLKIMVSPVRFRVSLLLFCSGLQEKCGGAREPPRGPGALWQQRGSSRKLREQCS
jgi:hypothetical protein